MNSIDEDALRMKSGRSLYYPPKKMIIKIRKIKIRGNDGVEVVNKGVIGTRGVNKSLVIVIIIV